MSQHHHHHHDGGRDDHHDHSHQGHDHTNDLTPALQSSLYSQIDFDKIITLNEREPRSGMAVVKKTWEERLDPEPELVSDADEQLLMRIPFTGLCTLHSLLLHYPPTPTAPSTIHLYRNRGGDDLDFGTAADLTPTQTLKVAPPLSSTGSGGGGGGDGGILEMPLNRALWNGTTSITLFVESNHSSSDGDEDTTVITYIGLRGSWMRLNREPVSVLYESAANPSDHKVIQGLGVGVGLGQDMQGR